MSALLLDTWKELRWKTGDEMGDTGGSRGWTRVTIFGAHIKTH